MKIPVLLVIVACLVVLAVGLITTEFTVYLGNNPTACNNCHVMDAAYESWYHANHMRWATCVECHAPHAVIPKYLFKAKSGMNDVFHFSLGLIPEPIRAKPATKKIVQANCIRCHTETVSMVADGQADAGRYCADCHRSVAHGERGLTIMPYQDKIFYEPDVITH